MSVIKEILLKISPLTSHLSRSLRIITTDMIDLPPDFLLKLHSNHGPISYRFLDKRRFQSKTANFSHPSVFNNGSGYVLSCSAHWACPASQYKMHVSVPNILTAMAMKVEEFLSFTLF